MRACYPGPVGGDNLVSPGYLRVGPCLGQFCLATTVAGVRSDTGATQDRTWKGMNVGGTVRVPGNRQVLLEQHRST
jgi:hypothetical protein